VLITHLLTNYSSILPGNPRLIIRVASAWAMLRAVARSLNLEAAAEPANEVLVRAAVIWIRFPVLADEILDSLHGHELNARFSAGQCLRNPAVIQAPVGRALRLVA